ncbi:histidine kinase [Tistrella bauzanensis]|uniref:histidine kinase n=1 Tax=Tistrella bauzanensis TaxID=657419 RepID=A0ABQ1IWJ8_9PROT|nr:ATP-binding protein [Tistrella bauzanensis]GGB54005.1 histidine kinase [Tistrella bauzanensis]
MAGFDRSEITRLLGATAAIAAPSAGTLAGLGLVGALSWWWAVAGMLVALAGSIAVAQLLLGGFHALRDFAEALAQGEERPAPPPGGRIVQDIARAMLRLWLKERRRTERLAIQASDFAQILDRLPLLVLTVDERIRIRSANRAAEEAMGEGLVGRELVAVLRHPALLDAVDQALVRGDFADVVFSTAAPDRREYKAHVETLRAGDDPGDARRAVIALHDLTQIRKLEQMRADFVANASHEIRTPLATLIGFIETLRGPAKDDPEAAEHFLSIMDDQARRMSRLVNDLLSLSRIEMNEHMPPAQAVDLVDVVDDVISGLEFKARARGIEIEVGAEPGLPSALGDADELAQVAQNLIDNAIKYGRNDSRITVRLFRTTQAPRPVGLAAVMDAVAFSVTDQGDGIPREHLPRLTERFYRVDSARSRQVGSTGLGLAIVKHIINRHRGHLAIDSKSGEGSSFTIFLPVAGTADGARAVRSSAAAPR